VWQTCSSAGMALAQDRDRDGDRTGTAGVIRIAIMSCLGRDATLSGRDDFRWRDVALRLGLGRDGMDARPRDWSMRGKSFTRIPRVRYKHSARGLRPPHRRQARVPGSVRSRLTTKLRHAFLGDG